VDPANAVLIMGHMRCGSTLLMHLLLTRPDLIGCGERNAPYRRKVDLDKLEIASRRHQHAILRRVRYAVDQVNHDHLTPDAGLLASDRVRCVFLVREPASSIRSLLELTRRYYEPWTESRAERYYTLRLESLARLAGVLGRNRLVGMTYEKLVTDTGPALRRLEAYLGLESPLQESYPLQAFTGRRGDPMAKIRTGVIQRDRFDSAPGNPGPEFPQASTAFRACLEALGIAARQGVRPQSGSNRCS
jgi:hypothetical protein